MATRTLNQVVSLLNAIANSHLQIHAFKFGDPHEFYTSGSTDCAEMWLQIQSAPMGVSTTEFNFRMWLLDEVRRGEINELEIQSDMTSVAKDVVSQLRHPGYDWNFEREKTIILNYVTEHSPYKWSGVWFDFSVKLLTPDDRCVIPFSSDPLPNVESSKSVTIYNLATGETITTVGAGGRYGVTVLTGIQDTIDSNTSAIIDPIS